MTSDQGGLPTGRHHFHPGDPRDVVDHPAPVEGDDWVFPRPPRPWYRQVAGQWPLFVTLLVVTVGVVTAGVGSWRSGSTVVAAGLLLAAVLRLLLPERVAGLLCCRSRVLDVLLTGVLGTALLIVTWVVSPTRP